MYLLIAYQYQCLQDAIHLTPPNHSLKNSHFRTKQFDHQLQQNSNRHWACELNSLRNFSVKQYCPPLIFLQHKKFYFFKPHKIYNSSIQGDLYSIYFSISFGNSRAAVSFTELYFLTASTLFLKKSLKVIWQ